MLPGEFNIEMYQGDDYSQTFIYTEKRFDIETIVQAGGTVTVTVLNHGYSTSDYVLVDGIDQDAYNGVFQITRVDGDSFTYELVSPVNSPETPGESASGQRMQSAKCKNLTSYTGVMQVKDKPESTDVLLEISTANTRMIITALQGTVELTAGGTVIEALTFDKGSYDVRLISGANVVKTLVWGIDTLKKRTSETT